MITVQALRQKKKKLRACLSKHNHEMTDGNVLAARVCDIFAGISGNSAKKSSVQCVQGMAELELTNEQFIKAAEALNALSREYNPEAKIYKTDIEFCKTIQDVVNLVTDLVNGL